MFPLEGQGQEGQMFMIGEAEVSSVRTIQMSSSNLSETADINSSVFWRLLAERACYAVCGCRSLFAETGKLINSQCARLFLHHAALCWPASFSKNIKM